MATPKTETREKTRCRHCGYLVEDENGNWVCSDWEKEIHQVPDDECAAETDHIWQ